MRRRERRKRIQPWIMICLLVVGWVGFHFGKNAVQNYKLRIQADSLQKEITVLEMRGRQLEQEIENWQTPEYVERVAREELNLVMPGETLYRISQPLVDDFELDIEKRMSAVEARD